MQIQLFQSRHFFLLRFEDQLNRVMFVFLIEQNIGTFAGSLNFLLPFILVEEMVGAWVVISLLLSSKALSFNIGGIESVDLRIIELEPFVLSSFDITDVMTRFGVTNVADNPSQMVIIFLFDLSQGLLGQIIMFLKLFQSVGIDIQVLAELVPSGNFLIDQGI